MRSRKIEVLCIRLTLKPIEDGTRKTCLHRKLEEGCIEACQLPASQNKATSARLVCEQVCAKEVDSLVELEAIGSWLGSYVRRCNLQERFDAGVSGAYDGFVACREGRYARW